MTGRSGGELFIADNSDELWKAGQYLRDCCEAARALDIATGYFEIGALLALDGQWQKLDQIRILMGDQVSKRTRQAFDDALMPTTFDSHQFILLLAHEHQDVAVAQSVGRRPA